MKITGIPVAAIAVAGRLRPTDDAAVAALARSIERDGLRHPIEVAKTATGYRLVAGAHRRGGGDAAGRLSR